MREALFMIACLACLMIALVMSCMGPMPVADMAAPRVDLSVGDDAPGVGLGTGGGMLPPGYYARQCQWDACNPPPSRTATASQPVRE